MNVPKILSRQKGHTIPRRLSTLLQHNHRLLTTLPIKSFEDIVGKGENSGNKHFLLSPQCFLPFSKEIFIFSVTFILLFSNAFNLDQSNILPFGEDLKHCGEKGEDDCDNTFSLFPNNVFYPSKNQTSSFLLCLVSPLQIDRQVQFYTLYTHLE